MAHANHCDTDPGYSGTPNDILVTPLAEDGSETSIQVIDNTDFPTSRIIIIGTEEIYYAGKSGSDTFTGCIRGYGTGKPQHSPGETVNLKTDTCYNFNNYADAWLDCAGHSDSSPELCPDAFQGNFYVDNSACYNDVSHVNSYSHTPHTNTAHVNSYSHTPHTNSHGNNPYYHTPHTNSHSNSGYGHVPFANTSHSHSCGQLYVDYSGHYDYSDGCGYHCNGSTTPPYYYGAHNDSCSFGNTSFVNIPAYNDYYHIPFYNYPAYNDYYHIPFYNYYSHTPYNHVPHYNVYSHTPFVDFCNHTDHNAG